MNQLKVRSVCPRRGCKYEVDQRRAGSAELRGYTEASTHSAYDDGQLISSQGTNKASSSVEVS